MRTMITLAILLLVLSASIAACAPALPIAPQDVPPEYVAYLSARWTATAGAEATESARATATESVARASSTQAYLATSDSLKFAATVNALHAVETAQSVAATDAASLKTETADTAHLRETQAAAIALGKATDEAHLRETQAAAVAERAARDKSDALARSLFVADLLDVIWYTVVTLCVMACVMFGVWGAVRIRERQIDGMVRVMLRTLPPGYLAQPSFLRGLVIEALPAPAQLEAAADERESEAASQHQQDWRAAIKRAVFAGIQMGGEGKPQFGERDLAGDDERNRWVVNGDGTPNSAGYRRINAILRHMTIWATAGRDTVFAEGWDAEIFEREFEAAPLPPDLIQGRPPIVRVPLRGAAVSAIRRSSAVPHTFAKQK